MLFVNSTGMQYQDYQRPCRAILLRERERALREIQLVDDTRLFRGKVRWMVRRLILFQYPDSRRARSQHYHSRDGTVS